MKEIAKSIPDGRPNMIALGIVGRLLGFTIEQVFAPIERRLADKGKAAIEGSLAGIKAGFGVAANIEFNKHLAKPDPSTARRWLLSGNEATALGAAALAGLGVGLWPDVESVAGLLGSGGEDFEPRRDAVWRRQAMRRWRHAVETVRRHYRTR